MRWSWVEDAPEGAGVTKLMRVPAWATKNHRERMIGLTDEVVQDLWAAMREAELSDDEPLIPGLHRKVFVLSAKAVGYGKVITLRDLRHCHVTWSAQGTGDAAAAQAALGHTDLRTTQRYLSSTIARTASAAVAVGDALRASRGPNCHDGLSRRGAEGGNGEGPVSAETLTGPYFSANRPGWMRIEPHASPPQLKDRPEASRGKAFSRCPISHRSQPAANASPPVGHRARPDEARPGGHGLRPAP